MLTRQERLSLMERLYCLVPSVDVAEKIVSELLASHIEEHHIHVLAKEGVPLGELPPAKLAQRSDVVTALERGIEVGGLTGVLAGLVAVTFPPAGLVLGGGMVLASGLAGAGMGALMSTMVGVDVPDRRIKQFEEALQNGELLLMVDTPKDRLDEIRETIKRHHRSAHIEGIEPTIPHFP